MLKRGSKMMQVGWFIYDNFLFTLFQTMINSIYLVGT